jgi:hypothetical protein
MRGYLVFFPAADVRIAGLHNLYAITEQLTRKYGRPMNESSGPVRTCFRDPIADIFDAARFLDAAVSAHLGGRRDLAEELIRLSNMPAIRAWTESIWGAKSPYVKVSTSRVPSSALPLDRRAEMRMPVPALMKALLERDGHHCRFCGIPVIRKEIRERIRAAYSNVQIWGEKNIDQHAAFQAMWVQYDHLVPHALGGTNDLDNLVITCAPCNFGRMSAVNDCSADGRAVAATAVCHLVKEVLNAALSRRRSTKKPDRPYFKKRSSSH